MMKRRLLAVIGLLAGATLVSLGGSGCTRHDPADSNIPWGRPAAWEDRVPGMGDF